MNEAGTIVEELIDSGEWVGGEGLADPSTARTVRVRGGVPAVTDGPFGEAKEQLAGYCIFECESARAGDRDRRSAGRTRAIGAIEVRPLMTAGGTEM